MQQSNSSNRVVGVGGTFFCHVCGLQLADVVAIFNFSRRSGWKHTDNVKLHYKQFLDDFVKNQAANGGEVANESS